MKKTFFVTLVLTSQLSTILHAAEAKENGGGISPIGRSLVDLRDTDYVIVGGGGHTLMPCFSLPVDTSSLHFTIALRPHKEENPTNPGSFDFSRKREDVSLSVAKTEEPKKTAEAKAPPPKNGDRFVSGGGYVYIYNEALKSWEEE